MPTTVQAIRVRDCLYCSQDSYDLLAEIGRRWMDCPAAHQSNLVGDVEQAANDAQRRSPADYIKRRANWNAQNNVDAGRLRSILKAWPTLTRRQQADFVEQIKVVVGS